jgi:hypothetical protein
MKRTLAVSAAVAALLVLGGAGVALGQTPALPSCGAATAALVEAQAAFKAAVADDDAAAAAEKLYATQAAAAAEYTAALLADTTTVPPTLPPGSQRTKDALAAKVAADAAVKAFEDKGVKIETLRTKAAATNATALGAAALAAQGRADVACKGADGSIVTPAPPAPIVVPIPRAINTGRA